MPTVVLYRQSGCASCGPVERYLVEHGVAFTAKDIDADPTALAEFMAYGYLTTPLVVIDGTPVPGWQPKRLAALLSLPADARQRGA
jgi:glutaredoxin